MTLTHASSNLSRYGGPSLRPLFSADLLAAYRDRIVDSVAGELGHVATVDQISQVIKSLVDAFVETDGKVMIAAKEVRPLLEASGEHLARRDCDKGRVDGAFRAAAQAAQKGLKGVTAGRINHDLMTRLREDVMAYLGQLRCQTLIGFDRTNRLLAMSEDQRESTLSDAVFVPQAVARNDLQRLAGLAGLSSSTRFVVVVSVVDELPYKLRARARMLSARSAHEALVAEEDGTHQALEPVLVGQAVLSPPLHFVDIPEAVPLARRAADLLRVGRILDVRKTVPYVDLLGDLIVTSNPLLAEMLIQKHLLNLDEAAPARRLALGLMLVRSLESGLPTNKLAREIGIPTQTAHSRMQALRTLIGDALDDPGQRLELIVALRAVLPRWLNES